MSDICKVEKFPLLSLPLPALTKVVGFLDDYSKCCAARSCCLLFEIACDYNIWPNTPISDSIILASRECLSKALTLPPQIFKVEMEYGRSKRFPLCVPLHNLRFILQEPDTADLANKASQLVQESLLKRSRSVSSSQLIQVCRADRGCVRLGFRNNLLVESVLRANEGQGWSPACMSWLLFKRFDPPALAEEGNENYNQRVFQNLPNLESELFVEETQLQSQDRLSCFYTVLVEYYQSTKQALLKQGVSGGVVQVQPQWFQRTQLVFNQTEMVSMALWELESRVVDSTFALEVGHNVVRLMVHHPALARMTQEFQSQRTMQRIVAVTVDIFVCYYQLLCVAETVMGTASLSQTPKPVQSQLGFQPYGLDLEWTQPVIKRAGLNEAELTLCLRRLAEFVESSRGVGGSTVELFNFANDLIQAVMEYSKGGKLDSLGLGSCSITSEAAQVKAIYDSLSVDGTFDMLEYLENDTQQLILRFKLQMEALRVLDWCLVLLAAL
eukprot:TRINITY_DN846_c1_g1_i10.p1 TRINITY_DN846_c1_g1~~TRINITY_DN846_c1_g1_i10.p1  ORF type:complete len:498 (+),score=47.82 TRINITY_DN846_c1_g1_i10:83-1576(+)